MKAPDKIYAGTITEGMGVSKRWDAYKLVHLDNSTEYIRKDALLEWLQKEIDEYWADKENTMGIFPYAMQKVIDKVNSI